MSISDSKQPLGWRRGPSHCFPRLTAIVRVRTVYCRHGHETTNVNSPQPTWGEGWEGWMGSIPTGRVVSCWIGYPEEHSSFTRRPSISQAQSVNLYLQSHGDTSTRRPPSALHITTKQYAVPPIYIPFTSPTPIQSNSLRTGVRYHFLPRTDRYCRYPNCI